MVYLLDASQFPSPLVIRFSTQERVIDYEVDQIEFFDHEELNGEPLKVIGKNGVKSFQCFLVQSNKLWIKFTKKSESNSPQAFKILAVPLLKPQVHNSSQDLRLKFIYIWWTLHVALHPRLVIIFFSNFLLIYFPNPFFCFFFLFNRKVRLRTLENIVLILLNFMKSLPILLFLLLLHSN